MKLALLIDENLPAGLAEALGESCMHATALSDQPTDDELWLYARREGLIILTRDADFFDKLTLEGAPPKVVWFRTGNMRRAELEAFVAQRWSRIRTLLDRADLVEVHMDRLEAIKF